MPQVRGQAICTSLQHRFCLLYLTAAVLCCKSIYQADLLDFQGINVDQNSNDVHPLFVMIMQIAFGKTNNGQSRYGRAIRHKDVTLCCIGALSFYLMMRFSVTCEFEEFTVDDWCDNKKWFDTKLLVDVNSADKTKKLQNDSYGDRVKAVLQSLGLACNKLLHLGRGLGAKLLDLLEEFKEENRQMGQWSPDVVDNSYSSKLPMRPMRKLAGYTTTTPMYYNKRTVVTPPEELLRLTPIGKWVYEATTGVIDRVQTSKKAGAHQTALGFLKFLCYLNQTFLQDAAAMLVNHPDGANHPMYAHLDVLRSRQFNVSETVKLLPVSGSIVCHTISLFCTFYRIIKKRWPLNCMATRIP
jgi:Centromere DNA-binding protein complex CBF3 subunit, domain 2